MNDSRSIKASVKHLSLASFLALQFILLITNASIAQYHPFPVDDGVWMNNHSNYYVDENNQAIITSSNDYKYCANGNDTIINSITYKQIDYCSTSSFHGAWRYDGGRVYLVPRDSINEYLLYDFTLNTGDFVDIIYENGGSFETYSTYIGHVDTVIVNGTPRRRLEADGCYWIEGIGNTYGLFVEPWINVSNYSVSLVCMSTMDTLHYHNWILEVGEPGVCDYTVSVEEPELYLQNVEVFPNPTSGKVVVSMPEVVPFASAVLTNTMGQELANYSFNGTDQLELEIEGKAGIYFLEIRTSKGEKSIIRIMKQ